MTLQIGMLIGNKYKVTKLLKTGAVAHAVLVRHKEHPSGPDLVLRLSAGTRDTRLRKERDILRRLSYFDQNNKVVGPAPEAGALVDEGEHEGAYYLVTEYIPPGYTTVVQAWEQGKGEQWIMPICRAFIQFLSRVHQQNIEYYDIKRDHLYWSDTGDPQLRVIDFNLCKTHSKDESGAWQQEDLRSTAILVAQMLQTSQNWPKCKYPFPLLPDWPSPLDVRGLPASVSESTRAVLAWLHGEFYADADAAMKDLEAVERMDFQWGTEAIARRRSQAEELIQQAQSKIKDSNYDSAQANLRKAWACLPFKRVSADPSDDPLACQVYLHALWLRYVAQDEQMAGAFRSWLDGRYDVALDALAKSEHKDAPDALDWLEKRREIDDRQHAHWKKVMTIFKEGHHADAGCECDQYRQSYPADTDAALWQSYFRDIATSLNSHWWYDRYDRSYTMAMAYLPNRLDRSQDDPLFYCWQQDEKLQEMCRQMRHAVEMTDVAWQMFGACAFGMAQVTFERVEQVAVTAIKLHAMAYGSSPDNGVSKTQKIIQLWRKQVQGLANAGNRAYRQVDAKDFSAASEQYQQLLYCFHAVLNVYLKRRRPYWAPMVPSLPANAKAFPQIDLMQLFRTAKESVDVFIGRESELETTLYKAGELVTELQAALENDRERIAILEGTLAAKKLEFKILEELKELITRSISGARK